MVYLLIRIKSSDDENRGTYVLNEEECLRLVDENFPWFKEFIYDWKTAEDPVHFVLDA